MKKKLSVILIIMCLLLLTAAGCKDKEKAAEAAEPAIQLAPQSEQTQAPESAYAAPAETQSQQTQSTAPAQDLPVDDSGVPDETALFAAMEKEIS